jgi:hypothetical protein
MWEAQNRCEAEALIGLARSLAASRAEMAATAADVEAAVMAALGAPAPIEVERGFDAAGRRLRAGWLKAVAAETAGVLRSPTEREMERLAHSRHDAYGYERDFQPESLERRCERFFGPAPPGWSAAHVLFSSGQATLGAILARASCGSRTRDRISKRASWSPWPARPSRTPPRRIASSSSRSPATGASPATTRRGSRGPCAAARPW